MALTTRGDGTGAAFQINSNWFNDYKNALTGVMTDQAYKFNYRPGSGTTPVLTLDGDGTGPLIKGLKTDHTSQAFQIDSNGNLTIAGNLSGSGYVSANITATSTANADLLYLQRSGAFGTNNFLFGVDQFGKLYVWDSNGAAYLFANADKNSIAFNGNIQSGGYNVPRLNPTTGTAGRNIFTGTSTPTGAGEGDIWIKA